MAAAPTDPTTAYALAVVSGEQIAGRLVRLACQRHLSDLETGAARGLRFDRAAAQRALSFFGFLCLPEVEGKAGVPFVLQPWQKFIVGSLFGWKGPDGFRRFRTAYCEVGKGAGKSPMAAGVGLYGLVADGEAAAEVYSAATTREQAGILFRDAKGMAADSPSLSKRLDVGQHNIAFPATRSFFRPVSSEHRGLDGKRPHMSLIDELHEHPSPMVVEKMKAGTKGRRQALQFEITNSGYDRTTVCWQHREYSAKVLENHLQDDSWFSYICTLDPCAACRDNGKEFPDEQCPDCDQWDDEAVWIKTNPNLDVSVTTKYLREQVREAKGMPAKEGIVKRLNFCVWTSAITRAIRMDRWDECSQPVDPKELEGLDCFGGLDIGATSDFTAFVLIFPQGDAEIIELPGAEPGAPPIQVMRRSYSVLPWFWIPQHPVRRDPHMTAIIDAWRKAGHVKTTPGEVVDYDVVLKDIVGLRVRYNIREIAFDRGFQGAAIGTELMREFGDESIISFSQGIISMNPPFRELCELVVLKRLHHGGHPVLRWMASNTAAETRGGLTKPSKEKSTEKVDGICALVMSLGLAMRHLEFPSKVEWF